MDDNNKWLKEAINKLDAKVDKLDGRLDNVDVTLGKQHEELRQHIYRTELNEEAIDMLREDIKPIQKHVTMLNGVLKFIGIISLVVGLISGLIKIAQAVIPYLS